MKCSVPGCGNVRKTVVCLQLKFHCFPLDPELRGRWLEAIKNPNEAKSASLDRKRASVLKNKPFSLRVCSDHFTDDAYIGGIRTYYAALKRGAVPTIFPWSATDSDSVQAQSHPQLQDNQAVMDRPRGQSRSIGIQVNTPETCAATIEKPALQHIVDEEAIMQLMKTCPMCDRQCRCHKYSRGPYFIVFQKCYFCDFQRKWASQPEALNADAYKAYIPPRKKLKSNDTVTVEGEAQSSQRNKTNISESSVSESNRTLQCRVTVSKLSLDMINMHNK
ncbi:uncharacterized protein LOC122979266 isoform X2 [Thunnus albacares]|uniref:uncharacterized protein LOC122979266 isoform X2 n=1 Tax=Thunnus albacares TaxID=8236 RepID=UPI001CF6D0CA|nr:uncharacterized protein LOC122979266 isoform X2 [Thunnus albacares]